MEEEKDKASEGAPLEEGEYQPSLPRVFIVGLGQTGRELFCRLMGKLGAISQRVQGLLILVAITTGLVCPFLARLVLPTEEQAG